jgi:hypothetical protein
MQSQHICGIGLAEPPEPLAYPGARHEEHISQILTGPRGVKLRQPAERRSFRKQLRAPRAWESLLSIDDRMACCLLSFYRL